VRSLAFVLVALLAVLQYRLWVGNGSVAEVWSLKSEVAAQHAENRELLARNRRLEAEVIDLKQGAEVIEDRARRDLGMIGRGETFFQIVDP
jgi:cell division protein FtsB